MRLGWGMRICRGGGREGGEVFCLGFLATYEDLEARGPVSVFYSMLSYTPHEVTSVSVSLDDGVVDENVGLFCGGVGPDVLLIEELVVHRDVVHEELFRQICAEEIGPRTFVRENDKQLGRKGVA